MELKRGIDQAVEVAIDELKKLSKPCQSKKEIGQIGSISANNDSTIGDLIAEAMDKVGKDGVITVEEAKSMSTSLDVVEGMQFDRGYISPYFVTNAERMEAALALPLHGLCHPRHRLLLVRFLTEILDDFRRFVDEIWRF